MVAIFINPVKKKIFPCSQGRGGPSEIVDKGKPVSLCFVPNILLSTFRIELTRRTTGRFHGIPFRTRVSPEPLRLPRFELQQLVESLSKPEHYR
jgi:hypothetical protein